MSGTETRYVRYTERHSESKEEAPTAKSLCARLTAVVKHQKLPCRWIDLQPEIYQIRLAAFLGLVEIHESSDDAVAAVLHFFVPTDCVVLVSVVMVLIEFADFCSCTYKRWYEPPGVVT